MSNVHTFGGDWTQDKLERIRNYLTAYRRIFRKNANARYFSTVYVDAFAGTGSRADTGRLEDLSLSLFDESVPDHVEVFKGSVATALDLPDPFDKYMFIDRNQAHVDELHALREARPGLSSRIDIIRGDANEELAAWCRRTDWAKTRAVVFLDPYGMQVNWITLELLAGTKGVDLWVLVPLGQAVNRVLTRNGPPPDHWAAGLTRFLGTDAWRKTFYRKEVKPTLFGEEIVEVREADFEDVGRFFVNRLREIFVAVAEQPLFLANSRGMPIYLLCFAASNPKGAAPAIKIASSILGRRRS